MKTFIVAEVGSNHNGDLNRARWLIREAAHSGADAAKFQLWKAEDITPKENWEEARRWELDPEWLPLLTQECGHAGVEFMCTPFSVEAVELLDQYVKRWKVASYDVGKREMLDAIIATGKPLIISAGRTPSEVIHAHFPWAKVLHCVSQYPAPVDGILQGVMSADGFSDHTLSTCLPAAAVALGATIIEKHFTLHRPDNGPDHAHSLMPGEFERMVYNIREVEKAVYGQPVPTPPRPDRLEWLLDDTVETRRG